MSADSVLTRLKGPFNFLGGGSGEARTYLPDIERSIPVPVPIFLGEGTTSAVFGYPVINAPGLQVLEAALRDYLLAEERMQVARLGSRRMADFKLREHQDAWARYREILADISRNVMTSNFGRRFPELFWLHHSLAVVQLLQGTPGRIRKLDLEIGRDRGDALRYVVLFQYLEKVFSLLFDLAGKLAQETSQHENQLFPGLLTRMRDNVLLFTEDHIGRDLKQLTGYFRGYLKIDGRDFLYRLARLRVWHRERFADDARLRSAAAGWSGDHDDADPDSHLFRPGYVEHLTCLHGYRDDEFLSAQETRLWSALVLRLKEFELLHATRRLIAPLDFRDGGYVCDARAASRLGAGAGSRTIDIQTRPYDFTARWIIDPEVSRSGLIYDIRNFSSIISILRSSDRKRQSDAFQQFLVFQHRVESIIRSLQLHSEKYLGDGAFFSGRNSIRVLSASIQIQRAYKEAVDNGLPFDEGMRLALNYASYHLLPLGAVGTGGRDRYEVYGHGLVELSRLVSGKRSFDLDELKTNLVARGYDGDRVADFFEPLSIAQRSADRRELPFRAHLDADGTLVNEGIVATLAFLQRLERQYAGGPLRVHRLGDDPFVGIRYQLEKQAEREAFQIGFRRLGLANFKGLEKVPVFEIVDGREWDFESGRVPASSQLLEAVENTFTTNLADRPVGR